MSYSLVNECGQCKSSNTCTDRNIVMGAIHAIHYNTKATGHQGAGSIVMSCVNLDPKTPIKEAE